LWTSVTVNSFECLGNRLQMWRQKKSCRVEKRPRCN
jgi:hypothetical protein